MATNRCSSNRIAAEFVLEIAKIIRAYSGAGIFATQDLNDFFALDDGKYGKGIINNCKTKIILNMEDEEAQRVKNILHLSETEVMNITHFQRGNGLISTNNNNITVEFKASNLEKNSSPQTGRNFWKFSNARMKKPGNKQAAPIGCLFSFEKEETYVTKNKITIYPPVCIPTCSFHCNRRSVLVSQTCPCS